MDPKVLAFQFGLGGFVIQRNLEGVSHEDSLRPLNPGGNSLNWIVGHLVRTRNDALRLLGAQPLFDPSELAIYEAGRFTPGQATSIDDLKRRFDALGPALAAALERATPEHLSNKAPLSPSDNPDETIGSLLASIAFHEAYHLGQTGLARRLLGMQGAILAPGEQRRDPQGA
jgi:uncharacterized damage-inducible protein DinB